MRSQRVGHKWTTFTFIKCTKKILWKFIFINLFPGGSDGKESACNTRDQGSIPGSGRFPGEGNGNTLQYFFFFFFFFENNSKRSNTSVFLPGKSHGWRSLAGYSPWGHKETWLSNFSFLSSYAKKIQFYYVKINIYWCFMQLKKNEISSKEY